MKRKIVIPSLLLQLILVAVVASVARAMVYVVNPIAENGDAWVGCLLAGAFAGSIAAGLIARAWPETDDTNLDRGISWGGFSVEISGGGGGDVHDHVDAGSGDAGIGDAGGGDGGGGGGGK